MDLYKNILLKSVYVDLAIAVVVTVVLVVACVLLSKLFKKKEISKKIRLLSAMGLFLVFEAILIVITFLELSAPLKDISCGSFKTYTGRVEYMYDKSSRYTDVYSLDGLQVESARGFSEHSTDLFNAKVVYGENSKQIVHIELY